MIGKLINFVAFQVGWFACILGAAAGYPWVGPAVVLAWVMVYLLLTARPGNEVVLLAAAGAAGYVIDSILVVCGVMSFPPAAMLGSPSTLWMAFLWVNLAATLNVSLSWLRGRYVLAAALGAVSGPLSYYAGMRFGAVQFDVAPAVAVTAVAIEWAVSLPALLLAARACERTVRERPAPAAEGRTT